MKFPFLVKRKKSPFHYRIHQDEKALSSFFLCVGDRGFQGSPSKGHRKKTRAVKKDHLKVSKQSFCAVPSSFHYFPAPEATCTFTSPARRRPPRAPVPAQLPALLAAGAAPPRRRVRAGAGGRAPRPGRRPAAARAAPHVPGGGGGGGLRGADGLRARAQEGGQAQVSSIPVT